ncbi:hypothetical protein SHO565_11410 [Streptomyces sp. HO565]
MAAQGEQVRPARRGTHATAPSAPHAAALRDTARTVARSPTVSPVHASHCPRSLHFGNSVAKVDA